LEVWVGLYDEYGEYDEYDEYDKSVETRLGGHCVGMGSSVQSAGGVSVLNLGSCKDTW
jgi:hypothetical protein